MGDKEQSRYRVIVAGNPTDLEREVEDARRGGAELVGGVAFHMVEWAQAVLEPVRVSAAEQQEALLKAFGNES